MSERKPATRPPTKWQGARIVWDWPWPWVEIRCDECGRHGRWRVETIAARFGWDHSMPGVRSAIVREVCDQQPIAGHACRHGRFVLYGELE